MISITKGKDDEIILNCHLNDLSLLQEAIAGQINVMIERLIEEYDLQDDFDLDACLKSEDQNIADEAKIISECQNTLDEITELINFD